MANLHQFGGFVVQITIIAGKLVQYPARKCRYKMMKVLTKAHNPCTAFIDPDSTSKYMTILIRWTRNT
jgi:hypothetical protein